MSGPPHPGRKRPKKHEEEEHENHERWLVSYADMVTLLMCLFIVLFAMSQVDKAKFAALASGLSQSFGAPITVAARQDAARARCSTRCPAPVNIAAGIAPRAEGRPGRRRRGRRPGGRRAGQAGRRRGAGRLRRAGRGAATRSTRR